MNDNSTINYYNNNAESYYDQTISIDFEDLYVRFLKYICRRQTEHKSDCLQHGRLDRR